MGLKVRILLLVIVHVVGIKLYMVQLLLMLTPLNNFVSDEFFDKFTVGLHCFLIPFSFVKYHNEQRLITLSLSLSLSLYIYIYIYMCVCVCVSPEECHISYK